MRHLSSLPHLLSAILLLTTAGVSNKPASAEELASAQTSARDSAQDQDQDQDKDQGEGPVYTRGFIDTIVVTARKREENLQDVPMSINAFSAEEISELGVDDISRLSDFTPNFSFEKFGGRRGAGGDTSRPVIRGQSNILGEGNAAFFVDGMLYSPSILSFPMETVERVEVIKGPQSALFGRSTFSGAVNLITKRGTNQFRNTISARAGSRSDYEANFSSSGPLVEDKVFYFIHARYYDYGGEYRNELDGMRVGEEQSHGLNASLEFRPTPDLSIITRAGYNEDDDGHPAQRAQDRFSNNCFLDQPRQFFCGEVEEFESVIVATDRLMGEEGLRREITRLTLSADWDVGGSGFQLSSNSGYTNSDSSFGNDQTFLGDPINFLGGIFVRVTDIEREEWSTELRLESPQDDRFRYLAGLYYYERDKEQIRRRPGTDTVFRDFGTETVENFAVFGAAEFDITRALTARAELRWQSDEIGLTTAAGARLEDTFETTLPRFTLDYKLNDSTLLFAAVAKGNKPGAFNTDPVLPESARTAEEETAWNYETGVKWTSSDNRSLINVAGFFIDWTDQQLTDSILVDGEPISFISNAGETEVWGFELEGRTLVTDAFELFGSVGYTNAEFVENCDRVQGEQLTGFDCVSENGIPGGDVSGNQTPNSPDTQIAAGATYTYALSNGMNVALRSDYSYRSKLFAQVHNLAHTGDRHLLNLKASLEADSWEITFFVDNVLDDLTPSTVVRWADLANLNVGPNDDPRLDNVPGTTPVERGFLVPLADGRQFGVTTRYRF